MGTQVTVVGIGADGWTGFSAAAEELVEAADVVLGGKRHLAMLPEADQTPRVLAVAACATGCRRCSRSTTGKKVVALASGDPLVSGIATTLVDLLGKDAVEIVPAFSSVALARARMRWSAESTEVVTLVGRDPHLVARSLAPGCGCSCSRPTVDPGRGRRVAHDGGLRSEPDDGARGSGLGDRVAYGRGRRFVGDRAHPTSTSSPSSSSAPAPRCSASPPAARERVRPRRQITKRDVRARPSPARALPGQLLWDVGAGAGSVGHRVDARPSHLPGDRDRGSRGPRRCGSSATRRCSACRRSRSATGHAPEALGDLEAPHAIFIGGGATEHGVLDACWTALRPGGRLVVHGVTLETEAVLAVRYAQLGGELTRLHVEHGGHRSARSRAGPPRAPSPSGP